jgi:hypothetical protein
MTDTDNNIYFTHSFFYKYIVNSNDEFIIFVSPIEIRDMFLNELFKKSGWHVDTDDDWNNLLLYYI